MAIKSMWDDVEERDFDKAEGYAQTPYMTEVGKYLVRIVKHTSGPSQRNRNMLKFVPEFEILQTAHGLHPVGSQRSDINKFDKNDSEKFQSALGRIKMHLSAVLGVSQKDVKLSHLQAIESDPLKYEGVLMWLDILPAVKTKSDKMINPKQWTHIPKAKYAEVLAAAQKQNELHPVAPIEYTPPTETEDEPEF